jgi:peptide/nickel transport system substrate-binding protein
VWTRRRLLATLPLALIAAACGGDDSEDGQADATGGSGTQEPKGDLRVGMGLGSFPPSFDPLKSGAYPAIRFGVGETLTRLTPDIKIEPWLAESVTAVNPTTWRVKLREKTTFHDGSALTAQDVVASFRRVIDGLPAAAAFIPKETQITADDAATVSFTTPAPIGAFPTNLAAWPGPIL